MYNNLINMEKWSIVLMLLLLSGLASSYAVTNLESEADQEIKIQISKDVGNGTFGSDSLEENDKHHLRDCSHWSYPSTHWPILCPNYCAGQSQSPIDIVTSYIKLTGDNAFKLNYNFSGPAYINIKNNGHTAIISWDPLTEQSIDILNGEYTLAQFHFHWGCENTRGSEHTVDGHSYPMELHFVHYRSIYGTLGEAVKYSDGLAVMAVFLNVGSENVALKPVTDNLPHITKSGSEVKYPFNQDLDDLLPTDTAGFYYYSGSLTTPGCNEVVKWAVYKDQIELSQEQLDAFRSLQDHEGHALCDNYRKVQPLIGRTVYTN